MYLSTRFSYVHPLSRLNSVIHVHSETYCTCHVKGLLTCLGATRSRPKSKKHTCQVKGLLTRLGTPEGTPRGFPPD